MEWKKYACQSSRINDRLSAWLAHVFPASLPAFASRNVIEHRNCQSFLEILEFLTRFQHRLSLSSISRSNALFLLLFFLFQLACLYIYIIHKKIMFRNLCKQFQSIRSLTTLSAMDLFFATLAPPLTRVPEEFLLGSETANCLKSSDPVPIMRD